MKIQTIALSTTLLMAGILIQATDPGFSFHNKSNMSIVITFSVSDKKGKRILINKVRVLPDEFYDFNYDYRIGPSLKSPMLEIADRSNQVLYKYAFPDGKTIYINWGLKKNHLDIYPQQGPYWGITRKTDKGYPTKNNVTEKDFTKAFSNSKAITQLERDSEAMAKQIKLMKK